MGSIKAKLIGLDNLHSQTIQFDEFPVHVGRSEDLEWSLSDRWVSRRHCVLDVVDDELIVRDLESKHGTYVNNVPIEEASLTSGDKLSIGMCTFFVSIESASLEIEADAQAQA